MLVIVNGNACASNWIGELAAGAVNVVVEDNQDAFGEIPAHRGDLVAGIDGVILELRLGGHRSNSFEISLELAVGVELDRVAWDAGDRAGFVRGHHGALKGRG